MVDFVGEFGVEFADRIVGEVREMNDGIEPFELAGFGQPGVETAPLRSSLDAVVEPSDPVVAGVVDVDIMPLLQQLRPQYRADVTLTPGQQYLHS